MTDGRLIPNATEREWRVTGPIGLLSEPLQISNTLTTTDGGVIVAFVGGDYMAQAIVRYGDRLKAVHILDVVLEP